MFRWEEECKGKGENVCTEAIINRMALLQFPGANRFKLYKVGYPSGLQFRTSITIEVIESSILWKLLVGAWMDFTAI